MKRELIEKGIEFAFNKGYIPIFLGNQNGKLNDEYSDYYSVLGTNSNSGELSIVVYDNITEQYETGGEISTLLCNYHNINNLYIFVNNLIDKGVKRVNIVLEEIEKWKESDIDNYRNQLDRLADKIVEFYDNSIELEVNVLTDRLYLSEHFGCEAGNESIALAPNGKFYLCPAFYFYDEADSIGDINSGIHIKNQQLLELQNAPICMECDAYHCMRCKFLNKKLTGEINTPSRIQCLIGNTERNITKNLQKRLIEMGHLSDLELMKDIRYLDPLDKILKRNSKKGIKKYE